MTNKEALEIVLALAIENTLDETEAKENGLEEHYTAQQEALEIVTRMVESEDSHG